MSGWVAGAVVVGSIASGVIQSGAAKSAANTQANAANAANATASSEYQQTRADQEPWRQAGMTALGQLGTLTADGGDLNRKFTMADFIKDPGYAFRMSEGAKAIERSAAARGGVLGGGTLKALSRYNQDFASQEYNNSYSRWNQENNQQFGRLSSIAGLGSQANAANQQASQNYTNTFSNNTMGAANASGAAQIGAANAMSNSLNTGVNAFTYGWTNRNNTP
jgi:hypothetical protein